MITSISQYFQHFRTSSSFYQKREASTSRSKAKHSVRER